MTKEPQVFFIATGKGEIAESNLFEFRSGVRLR